MTKYSFEDANRDEYIWYGANSGMKTHTVGLKKANPYGLHDMHGNVWEWLQDRHKRRLPEEKIDPLSWSGFNRVARGGSYNNTVQFMRSKEYRQGGHPGGKRSFLGFRLVRNL